MSGSGSDPVPGWDSPVAGDERVLIGDGGSDGASSGLSIDTLPRARPPPPAWVVYTSMGLSATINAAILAVTKQFFNIANFQAPKETEGLPKWYQGRYASSTAAQNAVRNVLKDTGLLMGATALWYGVAGGLRKVRGVDDEFNAMAGAGLSSALVGAKFLNGPPTVMRIGLFTALGAGMGYYGFTERKAMEERLLVRQQELQQKHLHTPADQVARQLDIPMLARLAALEEREAMGELKRKLDEHQVTGPQADGKGGDWAGIINSAPFLKPGGHPWPTIPGSGGGAGGGGQPAGGQPAEQQQQGQQGGSADGAAQAPGSDWFGSALDWGSSEGGGGKAGSKERR